MDALTDNLSSTLLISFLCISVICCIKWFTDRRKRLNMFKEHGIRNPPTNMVTGNFLEFSEDSLNATKRWASTYGDVYGYFMGESPILVVNDLDMMKNILIKNFSNFKDKSEAVFLAHPANKSLLAVNGPRWKETRSILTPTFSSKKMKLMNGLMNESVGIFLEIIGEKCDADESFDMYALTQGLTMDVIGKCALALKVDCQRDPQDELLLASREFFRTIFNPSVVVALIFPPILKFMQFINRYTTPGKILDVIAEKLKNVIAYRKKNTANRYVDMMQLMLDAAETDERGNRSDEASKKTLTDEEIIGNGVSFIIAGYETTANALGYTFYLLAKHQDVQDKLREELNEHLSEDSSDSHDVVNSLGYLDQVFNESLRVYPPVLFFINRTCASTTNINGVTILKGVDVEVHPHVIHHNPKYWPNPEEFDPSRFSPENKKNIHPMAFIPFGAGPRNCVGMRFAQMEAKLAISRVIRKYKLVFSEETEDPLKIVVPGVTANPANGVILRALKLT